MQYVFGAYRLDTRCYELRSFGGVIPLERQAFVILEYLIEHRDRVVLRQELFDYVWPDRFVSDASLEQCIAVVRRAVGDSGRDQGVIQTVRGRGYRFVADVHEEAYHKPCDPHPSTPNPASISVEIAEDGVITPSAEPRATYKPVTVLCGTLVGLTRVAEQLGFDTLQRLRQIFLARVVREVHRYEGTFQPFGDDGFLALFGVPVAQEDHARRALHTAIDLQQDPDAWSAHGLSQQDVVLTVRQGLHTGRGMVSWDGMDQQQSIAVVEETTEVAVRLQYMAEAGALLASATTMKFIGAETQSEALGLLSLSGSLDPVMVYEIVDMRSSHPEPSAYPFVGRERELTTLHALFAQSQNGQGQVVGIAGEPGMGKSRLLEAFRRSLDDRQATYTYVEGHCQSYGSARPYLPVIDLLHGLCGITATDDRAHKAATVRQLLVEVGMDAEAEAPYLLQLLDVAIHPEILTRSLPEAMRRHLFNTLRQLLLRQSRRQCLMIAVENVHWIDPTSEMFLTSLMHELSGAQLLCLVTYRPGYRPPWIEKSYATQMVLQPLTPEDSLSVVQAVDERNQLSPALTRLILDKAEGNPFFLEELTQAVVEQAAAQEAVTIPQSIQGVIMARIDRLPAATRRLLQTASVLGREISSHLLELIWTESSALATHLQTLKQLEFLHTRFAGDDAVYVFKHALTQEVAYESLLPGQRQALHAKAGQVLESLYSDCLEAIYDRLAYHYANAGEADKAATYLTCLAEKAAHNYAHVEAATLWQEALEHVEHLPDEGRDKRCLQLVVPLAESLMRLGRLREGEALLLQNQNRLACVQEPTLELEGMYFFQLGYISSRLGHHPLAFQSAQRARHAAKQVGNEIVRAKTSYALAREYIWTGDHTQATQHAQEAVALLERTEEHFWLGMAYLILASSYSHNGNHAWVSEVTDRAETIGKTIGDRRLQAQAAYMTGYSSILGGDVETGIAACQRAMVLAPDPFSRANAACFLASGYLAQRHLDRAMPLLADVMAQLDQHQHRSMQSRCAIFLSEAHRLRGDLEKAGEFACQGLNLARDIPYWQSVGKAKQALGHIAQSRGNFVEAATYLQEALTCFTSIQARYWQARTHLDMAILAYQRSLADDTSTHLSSALRLFEALQIPIYAERTAQLAGEYGVSVG